MNFQPTDQIQGIEATAFEPVADIKADFTDNQWYCHLARQTVFFSAYSIENFGDVQAVALARNITKLAPYLLSSFERNNPGAPLSDQVLKDIISIEQVKDLADYPDKWSMVGSDIFEQPNLPMFRIKVASLKKPDADGNFAAILVLSTHSLFEGADAVRLSRSQPISRDNIITKPSASSRIEKLLNSTRAMFLAPLQVVAAHILAPRVADVGFKSVVIERARIRKVAISLGIRQQSLLFALATFALNDGGKGFSKKKISTIYADLNKTSDVQTNDSFFQFRMIDLNLVVMDDFVSYARALEENLISVEQGDKSATQRFLNAMFGAHRWFQSKFPWMYSAQLFRFTAGYDITLSMVPPQRMGGSMTMGLTEPVTTGTYHPGFNMCVFAPGRKFVTISFCLRAKPLKNVDKVIGLFDKIEQQTQL